MKLSIVVLALAVAAAAGQNFYLHFANPKNELMNRYSDANQIAEGFYAPVEVTFRSVSYFSFFKINFQEFPLKTSRKSRIQLVQKLLKVNFKKCKFDPIVDQFSFGHPPLFLIIF